MVRIIGVKVKAELKKTESEEKVKRAILNIAPSLKIKKDGKYLVGFGRKAEVELIKEAVWEKKILDTVRDQLLRNQLGNTTQLLLNKQAAYAGKIAVVEDYDESPMGAIVVEFEAEDIEEFIDWFAPPTKDGKPILPEKNQQSTFSQ